MNKHSKVILHYVFLVTGCLALGWLLGKLTTYMAIWAIQTWGAAFLAFAAKVTMLVVVAIPTWFGWKYFVEKALSSKIDQFQAWMLEKKANRSPEASS